MIWWFQLVLIGLGLTLLTFRKFFHAPTILLHLSRSHPRLLALLMGLGVFALGILLAEGTFYALNRYQSRSVGGEESTSGRLFEYDEALGSKHLPNVQVSVRNKVHGKLVYDVKYSTDAYGRRITPVEHPELRTNFLLFMGCSFTFGQGVNDHETLPFYVARLAPTYNPYNYGVMGYGPQSILEKLQSQEIASEIKERQGALIYTFIDHHIDRVVGSRQVVNSWGAHMPFYKLDAQDQLVRIGDFTSGRPLTALFYRALGASQIATYWNLWMRTPITEADIHLTVRLIEEARNVFRKTFHSERFYVLLYPGSQYAQQMIPAFEHAGINYLNYTDLFDPVQPGLHLEGDLHPTPHAYYTAAKQLVRDLGLMDLQGER